ncbi:DUF4142 domain-containing protein [Streptomyces sp. NPDC008001]|uniref:DUF4142 domain-containing protein n=1 Tax=Streptomyces sp. NPDC008001 TaxID=3364804 RepID=UPI0036E8AA92
MRMGHRLMAAAAALVLTVAPAGAAFACEKCKDTEKKTEKQAGQQAEKATEKTTEIVTAKRTEPKKEKENDGNFLKTVHQAGLAEIAMSRDARKNAVMPCVRKTAETLLKDHTRMDKDLRDLARRLKVSLPDKTTSEQRKSLRDLRRKAHRRQYDTLWLKAAETGHVQALAFLDDEIANGKNTQVREAARMARPVIADHLKKVQVCQKER